MKEYATNRRVLFGVWQVERERAEKALLTRLHATNSQ
jgi:hypothetical protein